MKKHILVIAAAAAVLSGCNDPEHPNINIDFLEGDEHRILNADFSNTKDKYATLLIEFMARDKFYRKVSIIDGKLIMVSDSNDYAYYGLSADERQEAAQAAFDSFNKKHGKVVDTVNAELPAEDSGSSKIERVIYHFEKENDSSPMIQFSSSKFTQGNKTYYKLEVVELHFKF